VRKDFAADNLSRLKKIVLNVLRLETATAILGKLSLAKNESSPLGTIRSDCRSWVSNQFTTNNCNRPGLLSKLLSLPKYENICRD